jgi:hypothetical protein
MIEGGRPKKNYKDEEGNVITEPHNFLTSRLKKGKNGKGTTFDGPIKYMEDEYDRRRKFVKEEMEYHRSKLQDKPFSQQAKRLAFGTFGHPSEVFGPADVPLKPAPLKTSASAANALPSIHDHAFKPANPGKKNRILGKFPEFIADPPKQLKRVKKGENDPEDKIAFKPNTKSFSRPTPSVVCNFRNIRTAYPSAFRK